MPTPSAATAGRPSRHSVWAMEVPKSSWRPNSEADSTFPSARPTGRSPGPAACAAPEDSAPPENSAVTTAPTHVARTIDDFRLVLITMFPPPGWARIAHRRTTARRGADAAPAEGDSKSTETQHGPKVGGNPQRSPNGQTGD